MILSDPTRQLKGKVCRRQAGFFAAFFSDCQIYRARYNAGMKDSSEITNFRSNFAVALEHDGRTLTTFAEDTGMSVAYLSRVRSGVTSTGYGKPIIPSLQNCEKIATALGHSVRDMLLPPTQFAAQLSRRRKVKA